MLQKPARFSHIAAIVRKILPPFPQKPRMIAPLLSIYLLIVSLVSIKDKSWLKYLHTIEKYSWFSPRSLQLSNFLYNVISFICSNLSKVRDVKGKKGITHSWEHRHDRNHRQNHCHHGQNAQKKPRKDDLYSCTIRISVCATSLTAPAHTGCLVLRGPTSRSARLGSLPLLEAEGRAGVLGAIVTGTRKWSLALWNVDKQDGGQQYNG